MSTTTIINSIKSLLPAGLFILALLTVLSFHHNADAMMGGGGGRGGGGHGTYHGGSYPNQQAKSYGERGYDQYHRGVNSMTTDQMPHSQWMQYPQGSRTGRNGSNR